MNTEEDFIEIDENADPTEFPLWYKQMMKLPQKKRQDIVNVAMVRIKETKPETYKFIKEHRCRVVGLCPAIEYALVDKSEGDIDVTWIHGFSLPTLLFWHPKGDFGFFVNANLKYNDTVLNKIKGNNVDKNIRGFTG